MNKAINLVLIISFLILFSNSQAFGVETIPSVSLENLYKEADFVAFVKILSGDVEHYDGAIYKAEVQKAYKGAKEKEIIYFGELTSYGIGSEYLAFFKKTNRAIAQQVDKNVPGDSAPFDPKQTFLRIMYAGYSILPVGFECLFDGKNIEKCDYAIQLNIKQILLPPTMVAFPEENKMKSPSDNRWVKKAAIEAALETIKTKNP